MKLKIKKAGKEILNLEVKNKEGKVKGNRFTNHLKKHRGSYGLMLGSGVTAITMAIVHKTEMKEELYKAYMHGTNVMHHALWEYLADNVRDGILKFELIKDTDDETLKNNMDIFKQLVEHKED